MAQVSVYFFTGWDSDDGENVRSKRMATLDTIAGKGEPLLDTARSVGSDELDGGFYPRPKVWIVEIHDRVSIQQGNQRIRVPEGEYTMRARPAETYSVSGPKWAIPFELSRDQVDA